MENDLKNVVTGETVVIPDDQIPPLTRADEHGNIITSETAPDGTSPTPDPVQTVFAEEDEVRTILRLLFGAGGWIYKHEHWTDEDTMQDIEIMLPSAVRWVNQWQWMAKAVKTGDTQLFPVQLLYQWGKRWMLSRRLLKAENKKDMSVSEAMRYGSYPTND